MPPIPITTADEFKRLLSALAGNVIGGAIHYRMFRDLSRDLSKKEIVVTQSRAFWHLIIRAHLQNSLGLLCKAYEQNNSALHLHNWLETIQWNLALFDETEFRERLKDNPFVDSLAEHPKKPDEEQLWVDIKWCSNRENPLVHKLTIHRSNIIAHTGAKFIIQEHQAG